MLLELVEVELVLDEELEVLLEEDELELLDEELELLDEELLLEVVGVSPVGLLLLSQPETARPAPSASPAQAAWGHFGGRVMRALPSFGWSVRAEAHGASAPGMGQARAVRWNGAARTVRRTGYRRSMCRRPRAVPEQR